LENQKLLGLGLIAETRIAKCNKIPEVTRNAEN